jgi:5'-nucleotidase
MAGKKGVAGPMRSTLLAIPALLLIGCATRPAAPEPSVPAAVVTAAPPVTAAPARRMHVQVLALNDFHGNLEPPHGHDGSVAAPGGERIPAGGAAYLAAHVRRLAQDNPNTVVVSAGDLTGASPLVSNLFQDEPTVLVMNRLGLDFEGVGNHDFDRGLAELTRLQRGGPATHVGAAGDAGAEPPFAGARFQYLAANVLGPDGKPVFAPYAVKEFGDVKVAFIGMTLEGTRFVTTREAIQGLTFASEAKTANALLPELHAQGVSAAVILLHQGGMQDDQGTFDSCSGFTGEILPVLEGLDPAFRVVLSGHTHQAYNCTIGDRLVTSAGSYGRLVTAVDLTIDPGGQALVEAHARNVPVTHDIAPDLDVAMLVADYEARARPVTDRVVGYQRGPLTRDPKTAASTSCETPMGDLIADAQLAATRKAGAVLAFMNPGGVRADLTPATGPGDVQPIRYGAAFEVQPFGNRLVTLSMTGAQIRSLLERQFGRDRPRVMSVSRGFTYRYVYDAGARTVSIDPSTIRLGGKAVDPRRTYRVTVNSFLADGGDGFALLRDANGRSPGVLDIEALVDYLSRTSSAGSPLTASRWQARVKGNGCE